MGYLVKEPFWHLIDHWQTLIGGALLASLGIPVALGPPSPTRG